MSETDKEMSNIEKALTVFGQIIVDDRVELRAEIKVITKSLNKLLLSDVEARKEREYESKRAERIEDNQKTQGRDINNISENLLLQGGRIGDLEKKQAFKDKVKIGIYIGVGIAAIIGLVTYIPILIGK